MAGAQPNNPQQQQMSDESMLRNLAAQAEAIWPQERGMVESYGLAASIRVLDLACGPGEISARLLEAMPGWELVGVDLDEAHLALARARCAPYGERAQFVAGDAAELDLASDHFDLVICRHLLQAVPNAERVLANMVRVARPGGRLHVLAEDYGMMHFWPATRDIDAFWREGPVEYAAALGTDLLSGRKVFSLMHDLGLSDVRVTYVVVDTARVDRAVFGRIWRAWRDGYTDAIAEHTAMDRAYVAECFEEMIACIETPGRYAVWQVPVITGVVPAR